MVWGVNVLWMRGGHFHPTSVLSPVTLEPPWVEHPGIGEATVGFAPKGSPSGCKCTVFSCRSSGSPILSSPSFLGLSDSRMHPGIVLVFVEVLQSSGHHADAWGSHRRTLGWAHPGLPTPSTPCSVKSAPRMVSTFSSQPSLVWFLGPSEA